MNLEHQDPYFHRNFPVAATLLRLADLSDQPWLVPPVTVSAAAALPTPASGLAVGYEARKPPRFAPRAQVGAITKNFTRILIN